MIFFEMEAMVMNEYNGDARQLQTQGTLENLHPDKYMAEHEITAQYEGFARVVELIDRLAPQCRPQFRSDANKANSSVSPKMNANLQNL